VTGRQTEIAGSLAPVSIRIWACNTCIIHLVVARVSRMWKIVRSPVVGKGLDQAWVLGTATRPRRPGFASFSPRHEVAEQGSPEGVARRKAQTFWCPCPSPDTAGASRRATAAIFRYTPGRAFAVSVPLPLQRT
jgi:hypothetical protein